MEMLQPRKRATAVLAGQRLASSGNAFLPDPTRRRAVGFIHLQADRQAPPRLALGLREERRRRRAHRRKSLAMVGEGCFGGAAVTCALIGLCGDSHARRSPHNYTTTTLQLRCRVHAVKMEMALCSLRPANI